MVDYLINPDEFNMWSTFVSMVGLIPAISALLASHTEVLIISQDLRLIH